MMAGEEGLWDLHNELSIGGVMTSLDPGAFVPLKLVVGSDENFYRRLAARSVKANLFSVNVSYQTTLDCLMEGGTIGTPAIRSISDCCTWSRSRQRHSGDLQ